MQLLCRSRTMATQPPLLGNDMPQHLRRRLLAHDPGNELPPSFPTRRRATRTASLAAPAAPSNTRANSVARAAGYAR